MKRSFYLIMVLFFFSCEKNEMLPENNFSGANSSLVTRLSSGEVFVENGYLVVKNLDVLDSLVKLCNQMTPLEELAWENKMGFESAYSFYDPYFEEFENIESEEALTVFKEANQAIVKISIDNEDWDIDYPFRVEYLATVLSKEGKIKVGNSLWIYKDNRKIIIHNVTREKEDKYENAVSSFPENEVCVCYFQVPKSRALEVDNSGILYEKQLGPSNKRKYVCHLEILNEDYTSADGSLVNRRTLALYQKTFKKKVGGYKSYATSYWACVYNFDSRSLFEPFSNVVNSSEHKGHVYFKLCYYEKAFFPSFHIVLGHGSRGWSRGEDIDYTYDNHFQLNPQEYIKRMCFYAY